MIECRDGTGTAKITNARGGAAAAVAATSGLAVGGGTHHAGIATDVDPGHHGERSVENTGVLQSGITTGGKGAALVSVSTRETGKSDVRLLKTQVPTEMRRNSKCSGSCVPESPLLKCLKAMV